MKNTSALPHVIVAASLITLTFVGTEARAHGGKSPQLHVGNAYDSCYFDLHPELTQRQLRTFAAEAAGVARFQQAAPAATLGTGTVDVRLAVTATPINDAKGAWNNTFSHPGADHYLGDVQQIPRLVARVGVTDDIDIGLWGSVNPQSNYGFLGVDAKVALLRHRDGMPVDLAIRPSATTVLGPSELWFGNLAVDLTASRSFAGLAPYLGVGGTYALAVETSDDVDLDPAMAVEPVALAGLSYTLGWLDLGAEATWSNVTTYGVHVGGNF